MGRLVIAAGLFLALTTIAPPAQAPDPGVAADATLFAVPVPLDESDAIRRDVGELRFLRGWALSSGDRRFGGISALQLDGEQLTAISDAGTILRFALPRRAGAMPLRVEPLAGPPGMSKAVHDTEALLLHGASAWVAFERQNAIVRFDPRTWQRQAEARPAAMRRWSTNSGPEAMVRLADGRFLVFAEGRMGGQPFSPVALFAGDPSDPATTSEMLRYRPPPGFRVTDAALMPDGRLLILHRRFTLSEWTSAKLAIAELPAPGAGVDIVGREIAELRAPLTVDNMEGLTVSGEHGRTIVRIASDDNFMLLQRTLLLEFALEERPSAAAAAE